MSIERRAPRANLSRLLGKIRLLGADWLRLDVQAGAGFSMAGGDHAVAYFVTRGSADLQIGQAPPITLDAGATALLPHGWPHAVRSQGGATCTPLDYFDAVHDLDIPPSMTIGQGAGAATAVVLAARLHLDWPAELPHAKSLPHVLFGTRSYRADRTAAESAAHALETTASRPGGSLCLTRFAELLLARELRDVLMARPEVLELKDELSATLVRALEAVRMRPDHPWTVERLARHVGMSRSTFAAAFKAVHGVGPMEMVAVERMAMAARLLRTSRLRVKAIAAKVGYSSDTAFLRRFTAQFGEPPRAYTRRHVREAISEEDGWLNLVGSDPAVLPG